jgi:hypothetical protein
LANRLLAYRVAMELEGRRVRRGRGPSYRLSDVADRLLRCAARQHLGGEERAAEMAGWTDYQLAVAAGVSVRQTNELYEEVGLGALVREALDLLEERRLLSVAAKAASGPYRGFQPTAEGIGAVDLRPWYKRLLGFFDPPPTRSSDPA